MIAGEYVAIEFSRTDTSSPTGITIKDANNASRTLAATERLLIVDLGVYSIAAAGLVTIFADANNSGAVNSGERILEWSTGLLHMHYGPEGYSVPVGVTPAVVAAGAGQVSIHGTGRIVSGISIGPRPAWQADQKTTGSEG